MPADKKAVHNDAAQEDSSRHRTGDRDCGRPKEGGGGARPSARPPASEARKPADNHTGANGVALAVIVPRLSCRARSLTIQAMTLARDDPMRTAMLEMASVFALVRQAQMLARIRAGKAANAGRELVGGGRPLPDSHEQAGLARACALRAMRLSCQAIATRCSSRVRTEAGPGMARQGGARDARPWAEAAA